MGIQSSN